ncbi:TlpA family protein disulfide reductase [Tenacibaculum haliotis]|uniref:TlpA family protein disulfide reductase n=1 Tax=Tenacibaculum haliotis TaxID=1888914 RepID=UPI0021AE8E7F|nr:TlpA disulfide reductase family protein [Tenacibaculum haliotis]MCT4699663.1 TlpA family protein disulfide reductase [Tenacibaculum haliotis]
MKKHIFGFLILFIILCCEKSSKKIIDSPLLKKQITLIFKQRNYKKDTLYFKGGAYSPSLFPITYTDGFPYQKKKINPKNIKDSDTIIINSNDEIILNHRYHYYYNSSYLFKPGDTIIFNYKDDAPYCNIINRPNVSNHDLNFEVNYNLTNKIYQSRIAFYYNNKKRFRTKKEKEKYSNTIKKNLEQKELLLKSFFSDKKISNENFIFQKNKIKFKKLPLDDILSLDTIDLKNDSLLIYADFTHYLKFFSGKKFKPNKIKTNNGSILDYKTMFDSISSSSIFSKNIKNYLLYFYLKKIADNSSVNDFNSYYKKFENKVNNPTLINELKKTYVIDLLPLKKATKKVYFINSNKEKITLSYLINKNKGKLIYIDFWASWCIPCRKVMPDSKKLFKYYKDKDIVFIYVSIDKDFKKWENASKEEQLYLNYNSFFALNYPNANFYKELSLKSIPRYLLYDKNGKLIHKKAPSPVGDEIKQLIEKYIN